MRSFLLVLLAGIILTTVLTWPFLPNIPFYYTDQGDYATHGSIFWWNQDSIKTGRILNPTDYWHGHLFYPHPYSFAFANTSIFPSLIFSPIYWLTGSLPFSFNLYIFGAMLASFIAAFYTIRYFLFHTLTPGESKPASPSLGGPTPGVSAGTIAPPVAFLASLIGAFIFTFNPQTFTRFPHHVELLSKYFLPLIILFAYKTFDKPSLKNAFLLSLCIVGNSLTANYFQIFVFVMLPLFFLPFLVRNVREGRGLEYLGKLGKSGIVGLIFLPILLYFNLPPWNFAQKEGALRQVEETIFFSARINDWFAPPPNNWLYGAWSRYLENSREPKDDRGILNYEEHTLFIGILATFLFLVGLRSFLKTKFRAPFLIILSSSFVFIFGPYFNASEGGPKLPFYYLFETIPVMQGIRAPTRFLYILLVPFSIVAALGMLGILEKVRKIRVVWVVSGILLILVLENFTIMNFGERSQIFTQLETPTLNKLSFLKNQVTMHLPIYTTDDADVFGKNSYVSNWVTRTGEKTMNGNSGYLPPDVLGFLFGVRENVDEKALQLLQVLNVRYLVIHKNLLSPEEARGTSSNSDLYKDNIVFSDDYLDIIDVSKYSFDNKICSLKRDFEVRGAVVEDVGKPSYALLLTNKKDCYLASVYDDRYRELEMEVEGVKKKFEFRMPILVGPGEQVVVSEIERSLKVR